MASGETRSVSWENFTVVSPNKLRCLICPQELAFHDNTSSMMRHVRSIHHIETSHTTNRTFNPPLARNYILYDVDVSRKQNLDAALVDIIVMDAQPFSIVEDKGFKAFVVSQR